MSISIGEVAAIQFVKHNNYKPKGFFLSIKLKVDLWYCIIGNLVPHRSKPVQMKYAGAQVPEACQVHGRRGCRRRPSHNASPRRRRTKSTPQRSRGEWAPEDKHKCDHWRQRHSGLTPSLFVTITTSTTTFSGSRIGALEGIVHHFCRILRHHQQQTHFPKTMMTMNFT